VREDLGYVSSFADWVKAIRPEPWMGRLRNLRANNRKRPLHETRAASNDLNLRTLAIRPQEQAFNPTAQSLSGPVSIHLSQHAEITVEAP